MIPPNPHKLILCKVVSKFMTFKRGQIIQMTRADAEYYKQFVKEIKNERD